MFARHYQNTVFVPASPQAVFDHLDDPRRLSGHMDKSSWMMGGGSMRIETDELSGRSVGSRIRLYGRAFGLELQVYEAVVTRVPPYEKAWATLGEPHLLVIGAYRMGFAVTPHDQGADLRVYIDYAFPRAGFSHWLGQLFGAWYARWCTHQMLNDAERHFTRASEHPSMT